jgi:hypothetical protein
VNDPPIDVWDLTTFDAELVAILDNNADLIRNYMVRDHEIFLTHELAIGHDRALMRPTNAFAAGLVAFKEALALEMQSRTIRAWHYTRLKTLQQFASVHASFHNHFNQERHLVSRDIYKERRSAALAEWRQLTS